MNYNETIQLKKDAAMAAYNAGRIDEANYWQLSLLIDQTASVSWQLKVLNEREANNG